MAVEFPTGAYKPMAPKELADAILGAAREAGAKALDAYREVMGPALPAGLNVMDLLQGRVDFAGVLPEEPPLPDVVRDYVERGRPGRGVGRAGGGEGGG